jgi:ABC-type transporter Mla subunit MlaD
MDTVGLATQTNKTMTEQYLSNDDLLTTTTAALQTDLAVIVPTFDGLVGQWSNAFNQSGGDFGQIGAKLSELKEAVTANDTPRIAEVMNTLSDLTRQMADQTDGKLAPALNELATTLSDAAGKVAQQRA